jgi:hypothetical protein
MGRQSLASSAIAGVAQAMVAAIAAPNTELKIFERDIVKPQYIDRQNTPVCTVNLWGFWPVLRPVPKSILYETLFSSNLLRNVVLILHKKRRLCRRAWGKNPAFAESPINDGL